MADKWSGLVAFLAEMIEKYAIEIGIDDLPDITQDGFFEKRDEKNSKVMEYPVANDKAA